MCNGIHAATCPLSCLLLSNLSPLVAWTNARNIIQQTADMCYSFRFHSSRVCHRAEKWCKQWSEDWPKLPLNPIIAFLLSDLRLTQTGQKVRLIQTMLTISIMPRQKKQKKQKKFCIYAYWCLKLKANLMTSNTQTDNCGFVPFAVHSKGPDCCIMFNDEEKVPGGKRKKRFLSRFFGGKWGDRNRISFNWNLLNLFQYLLVILSPLPELSHRTKLLFG